MAKKSPKDVKELFSELIKISLGVFEKLSEEPTVRQWQALFDMAEQQALLGVCFPGCRQLVEQGILVPEQVYYEWLAQAGIIHQQNEQLNRESSEIIQMVLGKGYKCSVLKGQATASLYDGELKTLRQSGDIDIWVVEVPNKTITLGRSIGRVYYYDYHHADLAFFPETEIEMHYRPTLSRNLLRNARLQQWFKQEGEKLIDCHNDIGFPVPRADFNLILTLNHNFWHLLYEGVGLRQMMDLYFILRNGMTEADRERAKPLLKRFMLQRFARASMWVMQEVFGLEKKYMICQSDAKSGKFLLNEIMIAGNFGHYDPRLSRRGSNRLILMGIWIKHTMRLLRQYPIDVLWTPLGVLYISLWRRCHYLFDKQIHYDKR